MRLKKIDPKLVKVPQVRVTAVYDEELKSLLKDSLAAMGQVQPIVVVSSGEEYILVDGLHRLEEAKSNGATQIDAVLYEGDAQDALLKNLVLNRIRGKTKASEMVNVIGSLFKDYLLSIEEIKSKTGLGRDYIEKLLKISTASLSVQEALDQEIIGVGHAYEIARLPSIAVQDEVMAKYQVWRWTVKELHDQVEQVLALIAKEPPPTVEAPSREPTKYQCEVCKTEASLRYLRAVLLCPECFGLVWKGHKERASTETEKPPD